LKKLFPRQAGIAQPALRVQDPQLRRSPGRRKPIPRHEGLGPLPNHISAQSNPRPPTQLQSQRRDLGKRARQGRRKTRRLQNQQLNAGSSGQRSQSAEALDQIRRRYGRPLQRPHRQVQQQQIHGSVLEEHRRHCQRFLQRARRQDDQPVQLDSPRHGLNRIQASGQIQIRHDPARRLSLSSGLQREGRLAAGSITVQGSGRGAWQAAQPKDRVQSAKAGWYRPIRRSRHAARRVLQPL